MKILHIEDNFDIVEPIEMFFDCTEHEYQYSLSGMEGLKLLLNNKYDILLLDIAMPEFSGLDVIDGLEKENSLAKQKIVLCTAHILTVEEKAKLKGQGVNEILKKPISLEKLEEKMSLLQISM